MEKSKKELEKLMESERNKLEALEPSDIQRGKFRPSYVFFDGYLDLFDTIEALINVCALAPQGDPNRPDHVMHPGDQVHKNLKLVTQLLPYDEGEFLDEVNQLLKKEKL